MNSFSEVKNLIIQRLIDTFICNLPGKLNLPKNISGVTFKILNNCKNWFMSHNCVMCSFLKQEFPP